MKPAFEILFEDNHLLVVNKPVGLATMGGGDGRGLHALACDYLRERYHKPGKVFLGVVHRLDAVTSGAVVLARTSKAASRLSEQFRKSHGGPEKIYLAAVAGHLATPAGTWRDRVIKDEAQQRMRVAGGAAGAEAVLDYRVLRGAAALQGGRRGEAFSLVAVRLRTGRKHQIRVQFAARGHALRGDAKYGDRHRGQPQGAAAGISLHAASLRIEHPVQRRPMTFQCQPPQSWGRFLPTPAEWQAAMASWEPVAASSDVAPRGAAEPPA